MVYPDLQFPHLSNRPFFYANFVQTLDGKIGVLGSEREKYWPIGSPTDYATLLDLRAAADALVHGKNTAMSHPTVLSLAKPEFQEQRRRLAKPESLPYLVISAHPDQALLDQLDSHALLVTTENAHTLHTAIPIQRLGQEKVDLSLLSDYLFSQGHRQVLVEGGPTLLADFLAKGLIDQLFITLAPKIFGSAAGQTLTMVEGQLFSPSAVIQCELLSVQQVHSEVYMRYSVCHN